VAFALQDVATAATAGGTLVRVTGSNFGARTDRTVVSVTTPAGVLDAPFCTIVVRDTVLECALPRGTGPMSRVSVTVLGQTGHLEVQELAYSGPSVTRVTPSTWPTDVASITVTVQGSGFGSPAQSGRVSVVATGVGGACGGGGPSITLTATSVTVVSDTELSFVMRTVVPHVVPRWVLSVVVAGQGLDVASAAAATTTTQGPSAPAFSLARSSNDTHHFLSLTGANYGPLLSTCTDDVVVLANGLPCDALTMPTVRGSARGGGGHLGRQLGTISCPIMDSDGHDGGGDPLNFRFPRSRPTLTCLALLTIHGWCAERMQWILLLASLHPSW
jgi:hypothetical protein